MRSLTHEVFRSVLITQTYPVFRDRKEIDSLGKGHLCSSCKFPQAQLYVSLVAHRFLALTTRIYIFENTSVEGTMKKMVNRIVKHGAVIGKYGYCHDGMNDGAI